MEAPELAAGVILVPAAGAAAAAVDLEDLEAAALGVAGRPEIGN